MSTYEKVLELCKINGIAQTALEKELGFGRGSIGKLRKGNTSADRLQKIADYIHVSISYLTSDQENGQPEYYIDPETAELAQMFLTDPDYRLLYEAARGSRPEDVRMAADMLKRFKEARRE